MRTRSDYEVKSVTRRKESTCRYCSKIIVKGTQANVISCFEMFSGLPNVIGVTCIDCTEKFIEKNIEETDDYLAKTFNLGKKRL